MRRGRPNECNVAPRACRGGGAAKLLAVDVGGTHVKVLATGQAESRTFASGPRLTAPQKVEQVRVLAEGWLYDRVSVGYPGPVLHGRPAAQPHNLGTGWLGFDF